MTPSVTARVQRAGCSLGYPSSLSGPGVSTVDFGFRRSITEAGGVSSGCEQSSARSESLLFEIEKLPEAL